MTGVTGVRQKKAEYAKLNEIYRKKQKMNVAQKHRVVIHKKFIQSFSIKENILFAVVTNVLPTPPGESTLSVSTTPNQYADICLYTINLPDAVTGCHSNSDAIMLLCRHCCHRPLPKRYRDPSVCLSVPARRNCLRRAAAIGHRAGRQRCADCGQNKIK